MQNQRNQQDRLFSSARGFNPKYCIKGSLSYALAGQGQHSHGDQDEAQAKSKWDLNTRSWEMGLEGFSKPRDGKFTRCAINVQEAKRTLPLFPLVTSCLALGQDLAPAELPSPAGKAAAPQRVHAHINSNRASLLQSQPRKEPSLEDVLN